MGAVLRPNADYFERKVMRWYSKTFSTPLSEVEELPLEDVFLAYYEEQYADLGSTDREEEIRQLLITEEERRQMIFEEEAEDADTFEIKQMILADEAAKKKKEKKKDTPRATEEAIAEIRHHTGPLSTATDLPAPLVAPPPGISMKFLDEAAFARELEEMDGFGEKP